MNDKTSTINFSEVNKLSELIAYQEGSVVSRQLLKKKEGNITIFAFAEGEGLSEHTTPFDAMVYIIDGTAFITIGGENFSVEKGEMIIMPANVPHALSAIKQFKMLLIMIKSE
ncbi:MAG: cupin domain-containing protein [Asgard group archaeon]|nr:cupin domain-containing protein [Asgard group archaeon]